MYSVTIRVISLVYVIYIVSNFDNEPISLWFKAKLVQFCFLKIMPLWLGTLSKEALHKPSAPAEAV